MGFKQFEIVKGKYFTKKGIKHIQIFLDGKEKEVSFIEKKTDPIEVDLAHTLDFSTLKTALRWASGGGGFIFKLDNKLYLSAIQRDLSAPTNAGRVSTLTGRSDTFEECLKPNLILRELVEEVCFLNKNDDVLCPVLSGENINSSDILRAELDKIELEYNQFQNVPCSAVDSANTDVLEIFFENNIYRYQGILDLNLDSGDINFMKLFIFNESPYYFYDTEMHEDKKLKRNVVLIPITEKNMKAIKKNENIEVAIYNSWNGVRAKESIVDIYSQQLKTLFLKAYEVKGLI